MPPYLEFGLACLGIAASQHHVLASETTHNDWSGLKKASAFELFLAGHGLWGVMMEVDNREARLLESVLAVGTCWNSFELLLC